MRKAFLIVGNMDDVVRGNLNPENALVGVVLVESNGGKNGPIIHKRMKAKRPPVKFPRHPLFNKLRNAYADKELVNGFICPHKGHDLSSEIPDKNGVITWPASWA
jgi:hypothetical protein